MLKHNKPSKQEEKVSVWKQIMKIQSMIPQWSTRCSFPVLNGSAVKISVHRVQYKHDLHVVIMEKNWTLGTGPSAHDVAAPVFPVIKSRSEAAIL